MARAMSRVVRSRASAGKKSQTARPKTPRCQSTLPSFGPVTQDNRRAATTLGGRSRATSRKAASDSQACDESGRAAKTAQVPLPVALPTPDRSRRFAPTEDRRPNRPRPGMPSQRRAVSPAVPGIAAGNGAGPRSSAVPRPRRGEREIAALQCSEPAQRRDSEGGQATSANSLGEHWARTGDTDSRRPKAPPIRPREKSLSFPLARPRLPAAPRRSRRPLGSAG